MSISKTQAIRTAASHVELAKMGHNAYTVRHPYDWSNLNGTTCHEYGPQPFQLARCKRTETVARIALHLMGFDSEPQQLDGRFRSVADLVAEGIATCAKRASA